MPEKTVITEEQVVTRKGGYISYYDAGSTLRKAKVDAVTVLPAGAKLPEKAETPPPVVDAPEAEAVPTTQTPEPPAADVQPPAVPAPEKPSKPPSKKRGNKPKEEADMATKAAAKKAPAKKGKRPTGSSPKPGGKGVRTIGGKPVDISRYEKAKAPGGGTSYNNGDDVARRLQGKSLDEVYTVVAKALKVEEKELRSKYKALNVGMQRMNLGNRLRKALMPKAAK